MSALIDIPDEAVEAAARAIYAERPVCDFNTGEPVPFEQMAQTAFCWVYARAALAAADVKRWRPATTAWCGIDQHGNFDFRSMREFEEDARYQLGSRALEQGMRVVPVEVRPLPSPPKEGE